MSPFILTQAIQEVQVCIVGRGMWAKKKKKKELSPQKVCTLTKKCPPTSVHIVLFHHLKLAVKSTVVPNIYLHTKNS